MFLCFDAEHRHNFVFQIFCYVAKVELKELNEEGESRFHFLYVLRKTSAKN